MKKTTIIAFLLVACMATMCFVGGTFAKYTSTVSSNADTAKVAKWSFTDGNNGDAEIIGDSVTFNLFDTVADLDTVDDDDDNDASVSDGATPIIAPGTKGAFAFDITNASEVDATYTITFTVVNANNIPIVITYGGNDYTWTDGAFKYDDTVLTITGNVAKGADITDALNWKWAFERADNSLDTALGIQEATISITANCTFTQVD